MKNRVLSLLLLPLILGGVRSASAQSGGDYPFQGRANFSADGTLSNVDADRDRLILTTENGRRYTVDTYRTEIALRDSARAGETADLVRGMRVHVQGRLLSSDIIAADRVSVLALGGPAPRRSGPVYARRPGDGSEGISDGRRIELRGTVQSVDSERGRFVVRINTRSRTVFVNDDTNFRNIEADSQNRVPLRPGDRVTLTGALNADGTVDAQSVTLGRPAPDRDDNPYLSERQLTGRISAASSRFMSRDIKIRPDNSDRELKIIVPKGISIRRNGRVVSIHDLGKDDVVRVTGARNGEAFRASRIDVVETFRDDF